MANELIVNVTHSETRVARLENSVVTELFVERERAGGCLGNIYKGKVVRVLPGMQAAFIDIGLDRTAFLHASDVVVDRSRLGEIEEGKKLADIDEDQAPAVKRGRKNSSIESLLQEGNEIIVQVEKEPLGSKGARLTSHVSLPGRYVVYMPTLDHVGASRRIADPSERARLKDTIRKLRKGKSGGFIVRTVSAGTTEKQLKADIDYLVASWEQISSAAKNAKSPALIRSELGVLDRVIRDQFTPDVDRVVVDAAAAHGRMRDFVATFQPEDENRVELYEGCEPIFDAFGIEIEITRALGQKVWLKSGGYIIIEQTEALTAVDVNTGRFVGRRDVEDTIVKTNLEAVKEIVYQLRLRDIGGIVILDFIDMDRQANRNKVYNSLKEYLKSDKARTTVTKISELGLVEMTRKRTREDLRRQLTNSCQYCEGKGYLKSPTTVSYEIFREIYRELPEIDQKQIVVACHHQVAGALYDEERAHLESLEKKIKRRIVIKSMPDYHLEQFDVSGK